MPPTRPIPPLAGTIPAVSRPNILLITTDQHHYRCVGALEPRIRTPALDRLCSEGTLFERAYCSNPVCSPARASMITGLFPSRHHCWTIGVKLPEDVPTVGDLLRGEGYRTALIGKAHFQPLKSTDESPSVEAHPILRDLEFWRRFHGPWYGFEQVELARNHGDEAHAGQHYALWMIDKGLEDWERYFRKWNVKDQPSREHVWDLPVEYHYTTWTGERTVSYLEERARKGEPFFLWSSFQDPHPPYLAPKPWASLYDPAEMDPGRLDPSEMDWLPPHFRKTREERPDFSRYRETFGPHGFHSHLRDEAALRKDIAVYFGMISLVDQEVGRILDALDRLDLARDTLVLFTSDHGHFLGQHGLVAKGPFHFEDMIRIPMIVRFPGRVPAGRRSQALQSQVDFSPTFLAAAGREAMPWMQGINQLPAWAGDAASSRGHVQVRENVIVEDRAEPTVMQVRTYVDARYKITVYRGHPYGEMFDLDEDPGEVRNRFDDPALLALKARLLHRFVQAEMEREPTRMPRVSRA